MSRIILTRYPTGQERFVVGWDHTVNPPGCFWMEFTKEPTDGEYPEDWEEIIREAGFFQGIPLGAFKGSVPEDLRPLITDDVMLLLHEHAVDSDSGYNRAPIDRSRHG